jgi:hypothetical protein
MKRLVLTDALIREALGPDPHTTAPVGLLAQITADIARTPQRRTLRFPALPQSRHLAWVLVGAATLLLLLGALLFGGGSRNPFDVFLPPVPSPLVQRLEVGINGAAEIMAISAEEAWASDDNDGLWHRTATGWAGPFHVDRSGSGTNRSVRGLARMLDGRIVVGADNGLWVGNEQGWTRVTQSGSTGVAVDSQGVIWTSHGGRSLRSYRPSDAGWQSEVYSCGAGGWVVASSSDGSIWTAGIGYSGTDGVARLASGTCTEVEPWGDRVRHEAMALTTTVGGQVATMILDLPKGDAYVSGRIMTWDGDQWTTLREGEDLVGAGWNRLSYAPDGSLWAAFDGRLWRYVDGVETLARDNVGSGPVSVAPDGSVWFVTQDPDTGQAFVDRLLPGDPTNGPTPAPTASPQAELNTGGYSAEVRLLGINGDEAWVAKPGDDMQSLLWMWTAAGWTGPTSVGDTAIDPRMPAITRSVAGLGDGRLAIATDTGLWVGSPGSWTRAWGGEAWDSAMASDGRLWVGGLTENGAYTLRVLHETGDGWVQDWAGCEAGGNSVAIAADASVWTAAISFPGGVARVQDGECKELFPLGEGSGGLVMSVAASPSGAVAVHIVNPVVDDQFAGGRVMEWRDGRWTELHEGKDLVSFPQSLAYTPDGALWTVLGDALNRYADGEWTAISRAQRGSPISATTDGTVWYVRADGVVDRVTQAP